MCDDRGAGGRSERQQEEGEYIGCCFWVTRCYIHGPRLQFCWVRCSYANCSCDIGTTMRLSSQARRVHGRVACVGSYHMSGNDCSSGWMEGG